MTKTTRRVFDAEFKRKAVELIDLQSKCNSKKETRQGDVNNRLEAD